jgi:hypothetical protein
MVKHKFFSITENRYRFVLAGQVFLFSADRKQILGSLELNQDKLGKITKLDLYLYFF